jgi:hypothetical protein
MVDVIVLNPDAQGAIAVFMIPMLQGIGLTATPVIIWLVTWISRRVAPGT